MGFWEGFFLERDPNNLLTMLSTWTNGNIGNTPGFDVSLEKALASIKIRCLHRWHLKACNSLFHAYKLYHKAILSMESVGSQKLV